jgi:hypothetical protein
MFSFLMLLLLRPGRLRGNGPGRHLHTLVLAARIVVGPSTWVWVRRRVGCATTWRETPIFPVDPGEKFLLDRQNFVFPRVVASENQKFRFVKIVRASATTFRVVSCQIATTLFNQATMAHPWLFISPIQRSERVPWTLQRVHDPPPARTSPVPI